MSKIVTLFTHIDLTFSDGETVDPGTVVRLDTNVEDTLVLWTLDGSLPIDGNFGTFRAEPPIDITLAVTTRIRARAFKRTKPEHTTKTLEKTYTIVRSRTPMEQFRTTERFYQKMVDSIVDQNFYGKDGWVVPPSGKSLTYLYVNREPFIVRVNFLHNGVRFKETDFPVIEPGRSFEFPVFPVSGDNVIEIQTSQVV